MAAPFQRDPRTSPGAYYALKGICLACGLPEDEAPDLLADLEQTDGETYFVKQPETPEEVGRACMAIAVCCVSALRYGGTDPEIIRSFGRQAKLVCDYLVNWRGKVVPNPDRPRLL